MHAVSFLSIKGHKVLFNLQRLGNALKKNCTLLLLQTEGVKIRNFSLSNLQKKQLSVASQLSTGYFDKSLLQVLEHSDHWTHFSWGPKSAIADITVAPNVELGKCKQSSFLGFQNNKLILIVGTLGVPWLNRGWIGFWNLGNLQNA